MRQEQQVPILQFTPGTGIPVAQFHKIDGPIEFRSPALWLNLADALIDLDKGARAQQRVKCEILEADVTVQAMPKIQVLKKRYRDFTPDFDHSGKEVCVVEVEGAVKSNGEGDGFFGIEDLQIGQVSVGQRGKELMLRCFLEIHAKIKEQVRELDVIDGCQGIKFEYTGNGIRVLQLSKPGVGDLKFLVLFLFRNF